MARTNYLNNKDMLKEIHLSKISYCVYSTPTDHQYDLIIHRVSDISDSITAAKTARAERIRKESGIKESSDANILAIPTSDLVFRVMTWDHIPIAPPKATKPNRTSKVRKLVIEIEPDLQEDDEVPEALVMTQPDPARVRVNFPPFQHYRQNPQGEWVCVGKSHWRGDLETGEFCKSHGTMTDTLALMFMKLCERYATRSNWRGYCVDTQTQALTQRGWLFQDQITDSDIIMSFNDGRLTWSGIKSIYRGEFDGLMHKLTSRSIDSLITPNHKIVTSTGLTQVEHLRESDQVIVMGDAEAGADTTTISDALVELAGWIVTEGCYEYDSNQAIKRITVYQNAGHKADRIRESLNTLNFTFTERMRKKNINFAISRRDSRVLEKLLPNKNLTMNFILDLTMTQREKLVNVFIDGDGWRTNGHRRFSQKDPARTDMFQALCTIAGIKTNSHLIENHMSFGKLVNYYQVNLFSKRGNTTRGECINMHGGKRNGRSVVGQGKTSHPNEPTTYYQGTVWCPETEYGSFMARRNGKVYLTGNTYNDEMRGAALLQLSQIGLQFDESKSANPFSYFTATLTNSFTRILNIEKKNQSIRDDILEANGLTPSFSRQASWHKE